MAKKRPPPKNPPSNGGPPPDPRDLPLNEDEVAFVDEWMVDRNNTQAYVRTHPGCSHRYARREGYLWRHRPHVEAEINARVQAQSLRTQVRADAALKELARIAFSDIYELYDPHSGQMRHARHIPYETRKAIASVRVGRERRSVRTTRNGQHTYRTTVVESVVEYKLWNKLEALGRLCRHLGLDTEITPLEALLRSLPAPLSAAVRTALQTDQTVPEPSTNGSAH